MSTTRRWTPVGLGMGALAAHMALGVAARSGPSVLWMLALFSMTVGILSLAIIPAFVLRGRAQVFWIGFVMLGWFYMVRHFGLVFDRPRSVMNPFLDDLPSWMKARKTHSVIFYARPIRPPLNFDHLLEIGHSWLALLAAMGGGLGALFLWGGKGIPARRPVVIADLMVAVGCLAVALAAVRDPSSRRESITTTLVLTILVAAFVPALIRSGRERNYWIGFLACGWLCFLFHFGASLKHGGFRRSPLDSLVLDVFFASLTAEQRGRMRPPAQTSGDLVFIGNALMSLIAGIIGGKLARFLTPPGPSSTGSGDEPGRPV